MRGYRRSAIRRMVAQNVKAPPEAPAEQAKTLLEQQVRNAIALFPQYAEKVRAFRGSLPDDGESVSLDELPVWTRGDQRRLFDSLSGPPFPGAIRHSTGGSTGVPLHFYITRESYEWRMAVSDRGYSWAGAEEGRQSFFVWGTPVYPPAPLKRLKMKLHHALQRRTYFDSFNFDEVQKQRCCRMINKQKPPALVGYAGNLVELVWYARRNPGTLQWKAKTLITAAEGLHPGQRELLEEYLADEVFMSYGSREFALIGMECSHHCGYHIASDNLLVEVVDNNGNPAPAGETGRILVTDLRNAANPFIRYEIGDLGTMSGEPCPCGLPFPVLATVDGRVQEVINKQDGSKLTALFIPHMMKEFPWIEGYQVVQESNDAICINVVTGEELTNELTESVRRVLQPRVGNDMKITFERVDRLQKNKSGKTPIVIQITAKSNHG